MFMLVALHSDVNAGIAEIICHTNFCDRDRCQTRIFQFVSDNLRNLLTQRFRNPLSAMHVWGKLKFAVL